MNIVTAIASSHDGGKGRSVEDPLVIPRALVLTPIYHQQGKGGGTRFEWTGRFVRPHQSVASDYPIRWYGRDGAALNPKCEVPELKDEHGTTVGIFRVTCRAVGEGEDSVAVRDFYIRNRTDAERKEQKDSRWATLARELKKPGIRRISCAGGIVEAHTVYITLMNELFPNTAYKNMFGNWLSTHVTSTVHKRLLEAAHYLEKKLEDPDYGEVEEETSPDPGPVPEPDTGDSDGVDVDSDAGDDSGTKPKPRPKDLDIILLEISEAIEEIQDTARWARTVVLDARKDLLS